MKPLTEREIEVIRLLDGDGNGSSPLTVKQVAEKLGLKVPMVYYIQRKALKKIKEFKKEIADERH